MIEGVYDLRARISLVPLQLDDDVVADAALDQGECDPRFGIGAADKDYDLHGDLAELDDKVLVWVREDFDFAQVHRSARGYQRCCCCC